MDRRRQDPTGAGTVGGGWVVLVSEGCPTGADRIMELFWTIEVPTAIHNFLRACGTKKYRRLDRAATPILIQPGCQHQPA